METGTSASSNIFESSTSESNTCPSACTIASARLSASGKRNESFTTGSAGNASSILRKSSSSPSPVTADTKTDVSAGFATDFCCSPAEEVQQPRSKGPRRDENLPVVGTIREARETVKEVSDIGGEIRVG